MNQLREREAASVKKRKPESGKLNLYSCGWRKYDWRERKKNDDKLNMRRHRRR